MRVLLVEDDRSFARVIKKGLLAEGIDVDVESDGEAGLWRATEASYDAIVLDVMLPRMNGYIVCRELRAAGIWTPVIMLTAKDGEHDEAEALDTGADDYLRKPVSLIVLLARLRALVRRGKPERPLVIECGPVTIDSLTRTAFKEGVEVSLTRREFAVLELLANAGGAVVTTDRILDHVWGFDAMPDTNVVQVNVCYLRRKLDSPSSNSLIETVRGRGYRLGVGDVDQ